MTTEERQKMPARITISKGQLWIKRDQLPDGVRRLLLVETSSEQCVTGVTYLQRLDRAGVWRDDHASRARRGIKIRTVNLRARFDLLDQRVR